MEKKPSKIIKKIHEKHFALHVLNRMYGEYFRLRIKTTFEHYLKIHL
jgi:hypothetical protein